MVPLRSLESSTAGVMRNRDEEGLEAVPVPLALPSIVVLSIYAHPWSMTSA